VKTPRFFALGLFLASFCLVACNNQEVKNHRKGIDYIRAIPGKNDTIPVAISQEGKVLIAYSDCYTCHKVDKKSMGPAFKDIANRYPVQRAYIDMLAQKVISGGSGIWGQAVMSAHPKVSNEDAKIMVNYILSLKEEL
jgi:cytochrome c